MPAATEKDAAGVHRDLHFEAQGDDVLSLQKHLNEIHRDHDEVTAFHLDTDGIAGKHTFGAAHRCALIMGLPQSRLDEIAAPHKVIKERVQTLLRDPDERSDDEKKEGFKRRDELKEKHGDPHGVPHDNIVTFDGKPCAAWIAHHLQAARSEGVWTGDLISGFRTPEHSESICIGMCGATSCPGTCGGRSSNHACPPDATCKEFEGAADVHDPAGFQRYCRAHGNPLRGNGEVLPSDVNHFSRTGH